MSRLLVLGRGPVLEAESARWDACANRTRHLVSLLREAEHELCVFAARPYSEEERGPRLDRHQVDRLTVFDADEDLHLRDEALLRSVLAQFRATAIVAVGTRPSACACRLASDLPLWTDLFDYHLGEVQLQPGDSGAVREAMVRAHDVLSRADACSCASEVHCYAMIGELGLAGRLNRHTVGYSFVYVVPPAQPEAPPPPATPRVRGRLIGPDQLAVAWSAAAAPRTDVETLAAGVGGAMRQDPRIVFIALGDDADPAGAAGQRRVRETLEAEGLGQRCHFIERTTEESLAYYLSEADLGLNIDRPAYGTVIGVPDWVLACLRFGVAALTTPGCELADAAVRAGAAEFVPFGAPDRLRDRLLDAAAQRQLLAARGERGRLYARQHHRWNAPVESLLNWAQRPHRAPDRNADVLSMVRADFDAALAASGGIR